MIARRKDGERLGLCFPLGDVRTELVARPLVQLLAGTFVAGAAENSGTLDCGSCALLLQYDPIMLAQQLAGAVAHFTGLGQCHLWLLAEGEQLLPANIPGISSATASSRLG
ncbi:MAG TPA: hypothetical protein VGO06_28020 [Bosea sp. (in: a-proteobacteria)]|uniref:hypothetical protein n=1 Tax=Bosea sp. (in: a-proteobacteria) TaxID=1871050 RepID=UPI002E139830|nr:hypothetical protein [Bosea sp. (in: a-proteobacteria)]